MKERKFHIPTLVMTVLILFLSILEKSFYKMSIFETVNSVINPLLLLASLACGYLAFKDKVSFKSKWSFAVIAIQYTLTLGYVAYVPCSIFIYKSDFLSVIGSILLAAGSVLILVSLICEKYKKLLPIGFCVLAFEVLFTSFVDSFNITSILAILLYACIAVIAFNSIPSFNKLLKLFAVILAVSSVSLIGIFNAISWIILVFLLVPGLFGRLSLAKVTAILCVITALLSVILFFNNSSFYRMDYIDGEIDEVKYEISDCSEQVREYHESIKTCNETINDSEALVAKSKTNLADEVKKLDKVCDRSYYSSWYCDSTCRVLHDKVDSLRDEIEDLEYIIEHNEYLIEDANSNLEWTNERLEMLKEKLSELRIEKAEASFVVLIKFISTLFAVVSLICLAICFFKENYGKLAILACAVMAVASLLFTLGMSGSSAFWSFDLLNYPIVRLLVNPHMWSIAIMALLALIFSGKEIKLTKIRTTAVVFAIVMALLTTPQVPLFPLYALTLICACYVLVPAVFTEYNSIGKHIFLTIITFGIWHLIWVYNVTKNLNKVSGVPARKPVVELLLGALLPFYHIYWLFKTAEAVEAYGKENGKEFKLDILCLALAIVCPIISESVIQDKINRIVGKGE